MRPLFKIRYGPLLADVAVVVLCVLFSEWREMRAVGTPMLLRLVGTWPEIFGLIPQAADAGQVLALLLLPVHGLIFFAGEVLVQSYFVPVVYFAFIKARVRTSLEKHLFTSPEDLYYFRDTFPGMKPATVSLLMDLEVEADKDMAASLLQMVDKGQLVFTEAGLAPGGAQAEPSASEAELARLVAGERTGISRWKELSIEEAMEAGYLQAAGPVDIKARTKKLWRVWGMCLAVSLLFSGMTSGLFGNIDFFERTGLAAAGLADIGSYMREPGFVTEVLFSLMFWGVATAMIALIALPIYIHYFKKRYTKLRAPVRRTRLGEQAARQLYGLKNYIHDFTLLGEATKEKVALWGDFLVYAIVLEQNPKIIDEIAGYYPSVRLWALRIGGKPA